MKLKLENKKDLIIQYYKEGKTPTEIAKILKENLQPVTNLLKKYLNIKSFLPNCGNINYFSKIDSYSKAYVVGFIAADGALVKTKTTTSLTITLKYEDREILEFIKSEIGNEHKLQEIKRKSSFNPSKDIHHIRFVISNKQITKDLIDLGIHSNKSLSMGNIINNIPYKYRNAFIIGYFDGDGSVSKNNTIKTKFLKKEQIYKQFPCYNLIVNIRGTKEFLKGICNHLNIAESLIKQYDSIPRLTFSNKQNIISFFSCYNELDFFLKRKHSIFLERINHTSYDKYK